MPGLLRHAAGVVPGHSYFPVGARGYGSGREFPGSHNGETIMPEEKVKEDDGVKRDGLDYRAGYVEALASFLQLLQLKSLRCKRGEAAGLTLCHGVALDLRKAMLEKMKGV